MKSRKALQTASNLAWQNYRNQQRKEPDSMETRLRAIEFNLLRVEANMAGILQRRNKNLKRIVGTVEKRLAKRIKEAAKDFRKPHKKQYTVRAIRQQFKIGHDRAMEIARILNEPRERHI
jgi:hypothetical protein